MIRIERVALPAGLCALARRDQHGDLVIYVSDTLDAKRQRAAVLEAVRASRRAGWRAALPVGIALLAGIRLGLRRAVTALHARPAAWAAVAGVAAVGAAAGVVLATAPHQHAPSADGANPGRASVGLPASGASGRPGSGVHPVAGVPPAPASSSAGPPQPGRPAPAPGRSSPDPGRSSSAPSPTPSRSAAPSTTPTTPAPTPSRSASASPSPLPSPTGTGSGTCIIILGIRVCVPLHVSLSVLLAT